MRRLFAVRRALFAAALAATSLAGACAVPRAIGILGSDRGFLLVRHNQPAAQEIRIGEEGETVLGVVLPGAIACFRDVPAGPLRVEAHAMGSGALTRATDLVLTAERPLLWDMDHLQVLDGRAYRGLCE